MHIDQFGKYAMVRCPNEDVMRKIYRPYTLLRCLTKNNVLRVQKLKSQYKYHMYGETDSIFESSVGKGGSNSIKVESDFHFSS